MIPRVSFLQKEGEMHEIVLMTARVMRKLAFVFLPAYALFIVIGREFITFLFTANYLGSWPIFALNLTLLPFSILVLDPVLRAFVEHRYFLLKLRIVMFFFLIVGLWYGSMQFGMIGAVATLVLIGAFERLALLVKFGRVLNVTKHDLVLFKDVGKLALAAAIAGITSAFVRSFLLGLKPFVILVVCGIVFALVYLAAILLLKIITGEEFDLVRNHLARLQRRFYWKRAANTLS
jgi:O-antigen/teichoic acid export membrane protein